MIFGNVSTRKSWQFYLCYLRHGSSLDDLGLSDSAVVHTRTRWVTPRRGGSHQDAVVHTNTPWFTPTRRGSHQHAVVHTTTLSPALPWRCDHSMVTHHLVPSSSRIYLPWVSESQYIPRSRAGSPPTKPDPSADLSGIPEGMLMCLVG